MTTGIVGYSLVQEAATGEWCVAILDETDMADGVEEGNFYDTESAADAALITKLKGEHVTYRKEMENWLNILKNDLIDPWNACDEVATKIQALLK